MNRPLETINLTVNGNAVTLPADPARRVSDVLREGLGLRGTKVGCDAGDCGACTVLLDGAPVCACLMPLAQTEGREITTIEGLNSGALQQSFLRHGAAQCGICTPGMLMAATALLQDNPRPTRAEAEEALGGVLCRCTGYAKIIDAVVDATPGAPAKMPEAGAAVGARIERLDGEPKVDGTEIYGADTAPENGGKHPLRPDLRLLRGRATRVEPRRTDHEVGVGHRWPTIEQLRRTAHVEIRVLLASEAGFGQIFSRGGGTDGDRVTAFSRKPVVGRTDGDGHFYGDCSGLKQSA